jgi:hypothetical protein
MYLIRSKPIAVLPEISHERPLGPVALALQGLGLEPRDAQKLATALEAQGHSTPEAAQVGRARMSCHLI